MVSRGVKKGSLISLEVVTFFHFSKVRFSIVFSSIILSTYTMSFYSVFSEFNSLHIKKRVFDLNILVFLFLIYYYINVRSTSLQGKA